MICYYNYNIRRGIIKKYVVEIRGIIEWIIKLSFFVSDIIGSCKIVIQELVNNTRIYIKIQ